MLRISLIVPLYQGQRFISDALESVRAQDQPADEIIVVDDGSTDAGPQIVETFAGVQLIRQANAGPGAARNRGIAVASHEVIALLDQDDLLRPHALRRHREALESNPNALVSVCKQRFGLFPGESMPQWQRADLIGTDVLSPTPSCMCFRKAAFDRLGRFDESLRATSDFEWFRLYRAWGLPCASIQETLVDRRVHAHCQSGDAATVRTEMLLLAHRAASSRTGSSP